jgi:heme/copper-type cytochrome/quinol oxidase subunit 3
MTDEARPAREAADIRVGRTAGAMVGVLVVVVLAVLALHAFYRARAPNPPKNFPAPQLQTQNDGLRDQIEAASLFWHLVDAFWIVLFPLLYVASRA